MLADEAMTLGGYVFVVNLMRRHLSLLAIDIHSLSESYLKNSKM